MHLNGDGNNTQRIKVKDKMRIIIAGGGTGGHIFPALSIAEEIKNRSVENEVLFVGTQNGLEKEIIPKMGFDIKFINSAGFVGKGTVTKIRTVISALNGVAIASRIIKSFNPEVVLGVGGYASGPTVLCARLKSIPTAICEQNIVPGLTNRILSKFSNRIFVTFADSAEYFSKKKTVLTGNPLRPEFGQKNNGHKTDETDGQRTILVIGGSQGAAALNKIVPKALSKVTAGTLEIFHQTGEKNEEMVKNIYSELHLSANVFSFKNDIAEIYRKSDLIISRAGAGTISEITATGKASILVPLPHAAHNHQLLNARFMEKAGASAVIEEGSLDEKSLSNKINCILNSQRLYQMSEMSSKLAKPDAARLIVEQLYSLTSKQ